MKIHLSANAKGNIGMILMIIPLAVLVFAAVSQCDRNPGNPIDPLRAICIPGLLFAMFLVGGKLLEESDEGRGKAG